MLQWQTANGNGKWNTPNGNGNATSIACMHAYRKCKRLLSQARLRLRLQLSQTGAGPANDDTMADGSDKLKLFFARFTPLIPRQSKCTYRPTTFFSLATLGIVYSKKRFDLITANVRVLLLFVFVYTHTLLCVACRCIFQIFLCTVAHYALLCCQQMFSAFSHFAFWVQRKTLHRFSNSCEICHRVYKFCCCYCCYFSSDHAGNIFNGLGSSCIVKITTLHLLFTIRITSDNILYSV